MANSANIQDDPHGRWFVLPNTNLLQQSRFDGPLFSVQSGIQPGREDVDEYTIGTFGLALVEMNLATQIDYNPNRILRFPVTEIIHSDGLLQRHTPEAAEVFFRCIFERCAGILPNQESQGASCILVVVNCFVKMRNRQQRVIGIAGMRRNQIDSLIGADHFQVLLATAFSLLFLIEFGFECLS